MMPASDQFIQLMKQSIKKLYIKIEIFDSKNSFIQEITKQVSSSNGDKISVSNDRPIRRSFSFTLDNRNGEFTWGEDKLIFIDKRVKVLISLDDIEYIPQGVFILSQPSDTHNESGKTVTVTGMDKMSLFCDKKGKFINETKLAKGLNLATAIRTIATSGGETLFNFDTVTEVTPYEITYSPDDNKYKAMQELSDLAKCEIYYDVNGYLRLKKINTDFSLDPPVWTFKYGDPQERFYAGNVRSFDEYLLANHIRVLGGSGQTATVTYDLIVDETNPIWKDSPYSIQKIGKITYFHNNGNPDGLISTQSDAIYRAKFELMKRLGYAEKVSVQIAPFWLFEASDIIQVEDSENNVTGKYKITSFELPLVPSLMTCELVKYRQVISDWNFI